MKLRIAMLAGLLLGGCSRSDTLSGTYVAQMELREGHTKDMATYEFSPSGKVIVTDGFMGSSVELDYEIEGNRLKLKAEGTPGAQVFTINDDGSLAGPMGMKIVKKSS